MKIMHLAAAVLLPFLPAGQLRAETLRDADDRARIVRTPLLERDLGEAKLVQSVRAARIDFAPGQRSGAHQHPIPTMGIVLSGQIRLEIAGEPARLIGRGEAFYEPANTTVLHFDNASPTEPASFAGFYLLGRGETTLISPAPGVGGPDGR